MKVFPVWFVADYCLAATPCADWQSLLWSDEFNGSSINTTNWTFDIGTSSGGWEITNLLLHQPSAECFLFPRVPLVLVALNESYVAEYTSQEDGGLVQLSEIRLL